MLRAVAVGVVLVTALASCTSDAAQPAQPGSQASTPQSAPSSALTPDAPAPSAPSAGDARGRYVALGDSYTAGPLIPTTDLANGCLRSDHNYPSLLAADRGLRLVDVSCAGATTEDVLGPQITGGQSTVAAQLRAVTPRTDLVTLGIGGNDLELFSTLVQTCIALAPIDPQGSPCADSAQGRGLVGDLPTIGDNVAEVLRRVTRRAPDARVLLVGYLRIGPARTSCGEGIPFAAGDVAFAHRTSLALRAQLRRAAARTGVEFVDMFARSRGHDLCSPEPWVNGAENLPGVAAALHPLEVGMRAIADTIDGRLGARVGASGG